MFPTKIDILWTRTFGIDFYQTRKINKSHAMLFILRFFHNKNICDKILKVKLYVRQK